MIKALKRTFSFINNHPLAKRHLLAAYKNLFFWQVRTIFNKGYLTVPFIEHVKFRAKKGTVGLSGNIYAGLHEFNDMGFLLHFLKEEDTFYDVGANAGAYTLLASGVKKATTIAFEPIESTFKLLSSNVALNNLESKIVAINKGVGSKIESLYFTNNEDATNHVAVDGQQNTVKMECTTLDHYNYTPSLIKIDVEGYETEVIQGALSTLKDPHLKAIIIELNGSGSRYGYNEDSIHQCLLSLGFAPYLYNPINRKLTELTVFGAFNILYLRDLDFVNMRLSSGYKFKIFGEYI